MHAGFIDDLPSHVKKKGRNEGGSVLVAKDELLSEITPLPSHIKHSVVSELAVTKHVAQKSGSSYSIDLFPLSSDLHSLQWYSGNCTAGCRTVPSCLLQTPYRLPQEVWMWPCRLDPRKIKGYRACV